MTDFTKKGTKLPVIPVGTEYLTGLIERKWESHYCKKPLYSHGKTLRRGEVYIKAEKKNFNQNDNFYLIKLSTIERLAKEQGMWDDGITMTFKQYEPFRVLELQPDLKVPFSYGHEITIQTNQFLTTTDCEQCKSQQMNPKVTLQENGDVIISNTVSNPTDKGFTITTTTTLSKVTVDKICRLVKEDGEKVKLEVGKWYHYIGGLYVWNNGNTTYGFNSQKRFYEHYSFSTSNGAVEATTETVQQYLIEEAVKRGYEKGTKYKHIKFDTVEVLKQPENLKLNIEYNNLTDGCGGSIFEEGVWATILKPETITRAEAEKRYDVKITD